MRKLFKWLIRLLLGFLTLIFAYALVALIGSLWATNPKPVECDNRIPIYFSTNGVHLDIIFPKDAIAPELIDQLSIPNSIEYIAFGWGDRGFYLETPNWSDIKVSTVLNAMFLKSPTVMHVTHYRYQRNSWEAIHLCDLQIEDWMEFINLAFEWDDKGNLIPLTEGGYGSNDFFYEATGNYSLIYTCNNWINQGLKRSKVKTARWSPFDRGILYQIRKQQSN